jgi:hypothetical protein
MKKLLTALLILLSITFTFSQDVETETNSFSDSTNNQISLQISFRTGLGFVQDNISPMLNYKLGIDINNFKAGVVVSENYLFSTAPNNSIIRTVDRYYGIELSPSWINKKLNNSGIGVSYCPKPESELYEQNPIKVYFFKEIGNFVITTEFVWSEFFYPGVSIRF